MRLAHEAAGATDAAAARQLYARAFELEREAAALLTAALEVEPTRSVLHRSAVSLGLSGRRLEEAYAVLMNGLASRSSEVVHELRDLQADLDRLLAGHQTAARARQELGSTWNPHDWRARVPEILAAYLGRMDRYLELNGFSAHDSEEIVLLALGRLYASDVRLEELTDLDLALFGHLRDLCRERRPSR